MREQHNHHITLWAGIGGSGALAHTAPLAYAGGLSWQSYHLLLGGDILRNTSVQRTPPRYSWTEIDATVGYATAPRDLIAYGFLPEQLTLSASAGLSWYSFATNWRRGRGRVGAPVPVDTNASHVNTYEWGFGVPIQLQAHYTLLQYVGIGLVGFANINTKRSDAGVLLTAVISYY
ncbi:MAG: hypothetical protein JSS75_06790 [Bacteroidetes bacterium]|nr:hypothetical protein [Bacteroidota bacterium]